MKDEFSSPTLKPYSGPIAEMAANAEPSADFDIPVDKAKIENILKRDTDPMFVTLLVACEGKSENGVNYKPEHVQAIVDQINSGHPDGYAGHLTKKERATKTPDAQTVWLGAVVKEVDGKQVAYAKGYVLPSAKKRRAYLRVAQDIGKKVSVSVYGKFDGFYDRTARKHRLVAAGC